MGSARRRLGRASHDGQRPVRNALSADASVLYLSPPAVPVDPIYLNPPPVPADKKAASVVTTDTLSVLDVRTSESRVLAELSEIHSPAPSPDGTQIMMVLSGPFDGNGVELEPDRFAVLDLGQVPQPPRVLATVGADVAAVFQLSWAPDGRSLVYLAGMMDASQQVRVPRPADWQFADHPKCRGDEREHLRTRVVTRQSHGCHRKQSDTDS